MRIMMSKCNEPLRRLTPSPPEIGWYAYLAGAEISGSCLMGIMPLLLTRLAIENGYQAPNHTKQCGPDPDADAACEVRVFGLWIHVASFGLYVTCVAVCIQFILLALFGPAADTPRRRKSLLMFAALVSIVVGSSVLLIPVAPFPTKHLVAAGFNIVLRAWGTLGDTCHNAYIPILARWRVLQAEVKAPTSTSQEEGETSRLLGHVDPDDTERISTRAAQHRTSDSPRDQEAPQAGCDEKHLFGEATTRLASASIIIGCTLGFFSLIASSKLLTVYDDLTRSIQIALGLSSVVWAILLVPAYLYIPGADSRGDSNANTHIEAEDDRDTALLKTSHLFSCKQIRKLPNLYMFLLVYLLLNIGITEQLPLLNVIAQTQLSIDDSRIILYHAFVAIATVSASTAVPVLQGKWGWTSSRMIALTPLIALIVPVDAVLGLVTHVAGLRGEVEWVAMRMMFGFTIGWTVNNVRSIYSGLIPTHRETTFFSLLMLVERSGGLIGPALMGILIDKTGDPRYGFLLCASLLAFAIILLRRIDFDKGYSEAMRNDAAD